MIQKEMYWQSEDGIRIFAATWQPEESPRGVISLIHGFGEHCLRYTPYISYFIEQRFAFVSFDLRGHGSTEGKQGTIQSYQHLLNDVDLCIAKSKELFPGIPHFIYGHSMGGNLVLNYLLRRKTSLDGAIVTSPWLGLTHEPNFIVRTMVKLLSPVFPNMTIDSGLDINQISSVKEEVEKYRTDPKVHGLISFRLFDAISKSGKWALANVQLLTIPVLMMHGEADQITSPKLSGAAAVRMPQLIEFKSWPEKYHELHNEDIRSEVAKTVIDWLNRKLEK